MIPIGQTFNKATPGELEEWDGVVRTKPEDPMLAGRGGSGDRSRNPAGHHTLDPLQHCVPCAAATGAPKPRVGFGPTEIDN